MTTAPQEPAWRRLVGRTPVERLDRYTRVSTAAVVLISALLDLAGVAMAGPAPRWVLLGHLVLLGAALSLGLAALWPALDEQLGRGPMPRPLRAGLWLAVAVPMAWNLACFPVVPGPSWGNPHALAVLCATAPLVPLGCVLTRRQLGLLLAAVVALPTAVVVLRGLSPSAAVAAVSSPALYCVLLAATGRLSGWMLGVLAELQRARDTAARLAIAEERLRFSRDLHDVVGRSLSAVAIKSQLAAGLARRGQPGRSAEEMDQVHALATEALAEMRAVVAGYRRVDLATELRSARAMLHSAQVRCTVHGEELLDHLDQAQGEALGWALREGVTNVVRHSRASHCRIDVEDDAQVRLTIRNDGALPGEGGGSGLRGLAERLAPVRGTIRHERDGDTFVLTVTLPTAPTSPREPQSA